MRISADGYVGIGTTSPAHPLHVVSATRKNIGSNVAYHWGMMYYYNSATNNDESSYVVSGLGGLGGATFNYLVGVFSQYSFFTDAAYIYASDTRIKTNIVDIDDSNALSILRQIKPKTYDYVDKIEKGNANVIGFIAQEIKEIIPKAVTITTHYIPNFFTNCVISTTDASNIVLVTSPIDLSWNPLHDQSGNAFVDADGNASSDASGNKFFNVKLYDQSNNDFTCKTTNVLDKRHFLMDITGSKMVDASGSDNASGSVLLENDGRYFLHGQEVDDFHTLDKAAIFTVVTAAVQDIDRIVQAQAAKIIELENKNATLESQVASILAKLGM
jgi:hypothetical protein